MPPGMSSARQMAPMVCDDTTPWAKAAGIKCSYDASPEPTEPLDDCLSRFTAAECQVCVLNHALVKENYNMDIIM